MEEDNIEVYTNRDITRDGIPKFNPIKFPDGHINLYCNKDCLFAPEIVAMKLVSTQLISEDRVCIARFQISSETGLQLFDSLDTESCKTLQKHSASIFGKKMKLKEVTERFVSSLSDSNEIAFEIYVESSQDESENSKDYTYPSVLIDGIYDDSITPENFPEKFPIGTVFNKSIIIFRYLITSDNMKTIEPIYDIWQTYISSGKEQMQLPKEIQEPSKPVELPKTIELSETIVPISSPSVIYSDSESSNSKSDSESISSVSSKGSKSSHSESSSGSDSGSDSDRKSTKKSTSTRHGSSSKSGDGKRKRKRK